MLAVDIHQCYNVPAREKKESYKWDTESTEKE